VTSVRAQQNPPPQKNNNSNNSNNSSNTVADSCGGPAAHTCPGENLIAEISSLRWWILRSLNSDRSAEENTETTPFCAVIEVGRVWCQKGEGGKYNETASVSAGINAGTAFIDVSCTRRLACCQTAMLMSHKPTYLEANDNHGPIIGERHRPRGRIQRRDCGGPMAL